jgi:hypothetical protein
MTSKTPPVDIPGIEAMIDFVAMRGRYELGTATRHRPDHKFEDDDWVCIHEQGRSSWVSFMALVVLDRAHGGELALVAGFWDGRIVAYNKADGDETIRRYIKFRQERSKGKTINGRVYHAWLKGEPYITLN